MITIGLARIEHESTLKQEPPWAKPVPTDPGCPVHDPVTAKKRRRSPSNGPACLGSALPSPVLSSQGSSRDLHVHAVTTTSVSGGVGIPPPPASKRMRSRSACSLPAPTALCPSHSRPAALSLAAPLAAGRPCSGLSLRPAPLASRPVPNQLVASPLAATVAARRLTRGLSAASSSRASAASPTAYANVIYRAPHSVKRPLLALGDTARSSRPKRPRAAHPAAASMSGPSVAPPSAAAVPAAPAATNTVTHA